MKQRVSRWLLLLPLIVLSGFSGWVVSTEYVSEWNGELLNESRVVIRQAVGGLLALLLAGGTGFLSLHRRILKWWYGFPVLLGLLLFAAPVSFWMGGGRLISGTYWWQRSVGIIAVWLATIGGLCAALPRFAAGRRFGTAGMGAVVLFSLLAPLLFLHRVAEFFLFFGVLVSVLPVVLRGKRLAVAWGAVFIAFLVVFIGLVLVSPPAIRHLSAFMQPDRFSQTEAWQLVQGLTSIFSGGWTGGAELPPVIPEWESAFIFARLGAVGGAVAMLAVLLLTAILIFLCWRIVFRQQQLPERTLAAGCAAVLTVYPLFHIGVNLGLLPTKDSAFPFLSVGIQLQLFFGVLLGVLIALGRDVPATHTETVPAGRAGWVMPSAAWVLLLVFAFRVIGLVTKPPDVVRWNREQQVARIADRQEENKKRIRGRILDCNGRVLAENGKRFILCADPYWLNPSRDKQLLLEVARLAEIDEATLFSRIADTGRRYVRLKNPVSGKIAEAIRRMNIRGIFIEEASDRSYAPFPLAHLIGTVELAEGGLRGSGGVEMMQDQILRSGRDVQLTLDIVRQDAAQQIAQAAARRTKAKQVQIIVMNARNGAILAAAQVPAVQATDARNDDLFALNWRAVVDVFEPGGLIRPLVMASAFDAGVIHETSLIHCEKGEWVYEGVTLRDPRSYVLLKPTDILMRSSNIGMAKIGLKMGEQTLYEALKTWRLQDKCSAGGLGGATAGLLSPPQRWSKLEITRIPMGHACAFSLLQLMRAYTVFFNHGRTVDPRLIAEEPVYTSKPVIKPETARWMRRVLAFNVQYGGASAAAVEGIEVLGQSAVVQKVLPQGGYSRDQFQTSWIGGFECGETSYLVGIWLDEPDRKSSSNPASDVFRMVAERLR